MKKEKFETPLKSLPKLLFKKNAEEFLKKDKKDKLTREDLDDWIDLLKSFTNFLKWRKEVEGN
ncbi:MAG: hypothetical protein PHR61_05075 [Candidatus Absconditabacteria bacterium]|nr:hypothetical protein [Candidatus Absconditabacteria bacterium]